jgi:hypothetical protein
VGTTQGTRGEEDREQNCLACQNNIKAQNLHNCLYLAPEYAHILVKKEMDLPGHAVWCAIIQNCKWALEE